MLYNNALQEDYAGGYDNLLKVGYTSLFFEAVGVATVRDAQAPFYAAS